ncbi:MAG: hypothetical protein K0Q79_1089 [Flavipsychrobacter sp.]|nr:hypothetical protein [Flavipsychrobacter sp.]
MLQANTITFLKQLAKNNNKPWFDKNRDKYEAAKEDHEALVADILSGLSKAEPVFKEQKAKDCIFRIFRDVRFSKDKTPYKAHFGAFFAKGGRKYPGAGYYLHLEPGGKSFAGEGLWIPEPPLLKQVRQEIDYNFNDFKKIIEDKKFKKYFKKIEGEQLTKVPQGYKEDNPAIEYLKMKGYTVGCKLSDEEISSKSLTKKTLEIFSAMKPFVDFLNRPLD